MITVKEIKDDLKEIKYYYSRKSVFENNNGIIGRIDISKKLSKYNDAVCLATPRLYDLYVCLYIENNTQESMADKFGYSYEYINRLNSKLVKYFKDLFNSEEYQKKENV